MAEVRTALEYWVFWCDCITIFLDGFLLALFRMSITSLLLHNKLLWNLQSRKTSLYYFWGSGKQEWGHSCSRSLKEVQSNYWSWGLYKLTGIGSSIYVTASRRLILHPVRSSSIKLLQYGFPQKEWSKSERVEGKAPTVEVVLFLKANFRGNIPSLLFYLFHRSKSLNTAHTQGGGN